jgi:hypothetical protein
LILEKKVCLISDDDEVDPMRFQTTQTGMAIFKSCDTLSNDLTRTESLEDVEYVD